MLKVYINFNFDFISYILVESKTTKTKIHVKMWNNQLNPFSVQLNKKTLSVFFLWF